MWCNKDAFDNLKGGGAFVFDNFAFSNNVPAGNNDGWCSLSFDASKAPGVTTANENRPVSISALVCISY
jgi:hypothetical protein